MAIAKRTQCARPEHLFIFIGSARPEHLFIFPARNRRDPSTFFRSQRPEHLCPIRIPRAPFRKVLGLSLLQRPKHLFSNRNDPSTFAKGAHASAIGPKVLGWWRLQQPEHLFMGQKNSEKGARGMHLGKKVPGVCTLEKVLGVSTLPPRPRPWCGTRAPRIP